RGGPGACLPGGVPTTARRWPAAGPPAARTRSSAGTAPPRTREPDAALPVGPSSEHHIARLQSPEPIDTRPLFLPLHEELMALLRGLSAADWERPPRAGAWTVRDVVAHLLDGDVRRLTFQRDGVGWPGPEPAAPTFDALVPFLDRLNAEWIAAARRLSPRVLVDFLAVTGPQVASLFASLAPEGRAFVGVAWAGVDEAPNWLAVRRA